MKRNTGKNTKKEIKTKDDVVGKEAENKKLRGKHKKKNKNYQREVLKGTRSARTSGARCAHTVQKQVAVASNQQRGRTHWGKGTERRGPHPRMDSIAVKRILGITNAGNVSVAQRKKKITQKA